MNSFELNKVMGAVLGTLLFVVGLNVFSGILFTAHKPGMPGYDLPSPQPAAEEGAGQEAKAEPLPILLASADVEKGKAQVKKCQACHSLEKGGPNKIGPDLYGVLGRPKGAHEGFAYSSAMKGKGGNWSFDDLNEFITNPKAYVPGTLMAFAGLSSAKDRADVIKYLDTLSDNPLPLPKAEPAAAEGTPADAKPAGAKPAADAKPAGANPAADAKPAPAAPAAVQANPQAGAPQTGTPEQPAPNPPASGRATPNLPAPTGTGEPAPAAQPAPAPAK